MSQPKKKDDYIYFTTRDVVDAIEIEIDEVSGEIIPTMPVINTYAERSYARDRKGDKVVARVPQSAPALRFERDQILWTDYDYLCAVDTNTRTIGKHEVSITAVIQATKAWLSDSSGVVTKHWRYSSPFAIEITDCAQPAEKVAWVLVINKILASRMPKRLRRVGLIVDHGLCELNDINRRCKPILGSLMLPEEFTLIYASADTGSDEFANFLLTTADKSSSKVFKHFGDAWTFTGKFTAQRGSYFRTIRYLVSPNSVQMAEA